MGLTYPEIKIKLIDLTAKEDSTPTFSENEQTFSNVSELKEDYSTPKFCTLEVDQWRFGENFKVFPDMVSTHKWSVWSKRMSDANSEFNTVNLMPGFQQPVWTYHSSITVDSDEQVTQVAYGSMQQSYNSNTPITPNTQYTFTIEGTGYVTLTTVDEFGATTQSITYQNSFNKVFTFVSAPTASIFRIWIGNPSPGTYVFTRPQLVLGAVPLNPFQPYLTDNPMIDTTFTNPHSSNGITVEGWQVTNDYCNSLTITWYDAVDAIIDTKDFSPNTAYYFCSNIVENYYRISITFKSTNKPYRYLKIKSIEYGQVILFSDEELIKADLIEEIDLTTDNLTINTASFDLAFSSSETAEEILTALIETQEVTIREFVNNDYIDMGTFYIESKESTDEKKISVKAVDLIGQLANSNFMGGLYENKNVGDIIDSIFTSFGSGLYEVSTEIRALEVSGYLPIQSHKDSLQDVIFAVNGIINCSRSNEIQIYKIDETQEAKTISKEELFSYSELDMDKQLKPINSITLDISSYKLNNDIVELYSKEHEIGVYTVYFDEPTNSLSISGGVLSSSHVNYCEITVSTLGTVIVSGKNYDVSISKLEREKTLTANKRKSVVSFENTLSWNNANNADYLLDYETQTSKINISVLTNDLKVGDYIQLSANYGKMFTGYIIENDMDILNGFRGDVKAIGNII